MYTPAENFLACVVLFQTAYPHGTASCSVTNITTIVLVVLVFVTRQQLYNMINKQSKTTMKTISPIAVASSFATALFWWSAATCCNVVVVTANKDESYYANGITNPNVRQKMYWKEGYNVLQDLDQFAALYVTYHNCAWATPTSDDDDDDDENGNDGDGDDWYLGTVPSYRPNVAYSLYGILQGEKDRGCTKKTFINSFYTTRGVESFTNALVSAGLSDRFTYSNGDEHNSGDNGGNAADPTTTCYQADSHDNNNNNNQEAGDRRRRHLNNYGDDSYNYVNGAKYYSDTTSYGLGCSRQHAHTFAIQSYSGDYCDANAIIAVKDDLQDFNYRLSETTCVRIYSSQGDDSGGGYDDEGSGDDSSPLAILSTSRSCKIYDGSGSCPDPFGKLKHYEVKLYHATGISGRPFWLTERHVYIASWAMIGVGILCAVIGLCLCCAKCMNRKRRFTIFRRSSRSSRSTTKRPVGGTKKEPSRRSISRTRSGSRSGRGGAFGSSNRSSNNSSSASIMAKLPTTLPNKAAYSVSRANRSGVSRTTRASERQKRKNKGKVLPFFGIQ